VLPEQFESLRRFTLADGCSETTSTTVAAVASAAGADPRKVEKVVAKEIPRTFSEGFFADAVVFVEGDTDRVVLETLAERLGKPLDANGIAILAMGGKSSLKTPFTILNLIGIPVYIVADADADAAVRKHPDPANASKRTIVAESNEKATGDLLAWLPVTTSTLEGSLPFSWSDPTTVTDRWCVMHDNLETELEAWPGFCAAMAALGESLRSKNVAALRSAAMDAEIADLPATLAQLVEAIAAFG
jgi:hypothetical protein